MSSCLRGHWVLSVSSGPGLPPQCRHALTAVTCMIDLSDEDWKLVLGGAPLVQMMPSDQAFGGPDAGPPTLHEEAGVG